MIYPVKAGNGDLTTFQVDILISPYGAPGSMLSGETSSGRGEAHGGGSNINTMTNGWGTGHGVGFQRGGGAQ